MSKSDLFLLALSAFAAMMAVVGLVSQHLDPMSIALVLGLVTTVLHSARLLRRSGQRAGAPDAPRQSESDEELSAYKLLDIDERLEAIERREAERDEAERIRELSLRGDLRAPDASPNGPAPAARPRTRSI